MLLLLLLLLPYTLLVSIQNIKTAKFWLQLFL